ncbi:MAG: hypothetical protein LBG72_06305, partial [Spirochaetaceae bacterium]|nr:hypothetical protein [Spirochaetaceae bacterium]
AGFLSTHSPISSNRLNCALNMFRPIATLYHTFSKSKIAALVTVKLAMLYLSTTETLPLP